ncbi:MAG: AlpA family phage regulatory protein [Sphaerochaetaceae bacterium]
MFTKTSTMLRVSDVADRCGMGISTVWSLVKKGNFPQPVRLSPRMTRWSGTAVDEWIKDRLGGVK